MKLKTIAYSVLLLGAASVGGVAGRYSALDRDYRIERSGDLVMLKQEETGKRHPIAEVDGEVYVGSSDHLVRALQAMAGYEGRQSMRPYLDELQQRVDELEGKITKRRITDGIEDLADSVKDGWRNFKHNLIGD